VTGVKRRFPTLAGDSFFPWLALGPVSGVLAWRIYRCVRAGDHVLAGLYGVLMGLFWLSLAASGGEAVAALAQ
jgi:hypothetical protein